MFKDNLSRILSGKKSLEKISQAEIARQLGVSPMSLSDWKLGKSEPSIDMIHRLAEVLNVSVSELVGQDDKIEYVDLTKWGVLKVIGTVPAGVAIEAIEEFEGEILVPPDQCKPGNFALKVVGESMFPKILNGDVVIVSPCFEPVNGQIVVMRVNSDGEVTLKKFQRDGDLVLLIPENPNYQTRVLTPDSNIKILGAVVGLNRRF